MVTGQSWEGVAGVLGAAQHPELPSHRVLKSIVHSGAPHGLKPRGHRAVFPAQEEPLEPQEPIVRWGERNKRGERKQGSERSLI